jgi:tripartite-type tricarboxylate transporter receptor subunit TctC
MGGQAGWTALAKARPDGHTIALLTLPAILPHYADPKREVPFTRADFAPLAGLWSYDLGIAVRSDSLIQDLAGLIAAAKAKPDSLMVGDAEVLTPQHILVAVTEKAAGFRVDEIHFWDGAAAARKALLGGYVDALSALAEDLVPLLAKKEVRVLAVGSDRPSPLLPGVPTMVSLGVPVSFKAIIGLIAPAGTPPETVAALEAAVGAALADPDIAARLAKAGVHPDFQKAADLSATWERYDREFSETIRSDLR